MKERKVLAVGGDERQEYLAEILREKGMDVTLVGQTEEVVRNGLSECQIVLLPIASEGKLLNVVGESVRKGQKIYGGVFPKEFLRLCAQKGALLYDYMKTDTVAIQNAVATAEGAIAEAIAHSKVNLHGSRCLVAGFGRCGEILADKLKGLKSDVTVMARSGKALAKAEAYGYHVTCFDEQSQNAKYDFIFNTVPAMVIDRSFLKRQSGDVTIIDIASAPGGVDLQACEELGIYAASCLGLPAKYAPRTSAEILAKEILMQEKCQKEKNYKEKDRKELCDSETEK